MLSRLSDLYAEPASVLSLRPQLWDPGVARCPEMAKIETVKNVEVVDEWVISAKKDRLTHSVNSVLVFPFKWRFDGCFLRLL